MELEKKRYQDGAESEEGQVDPEDPAPGHVLREATTCIRSEVILFKRKSGLTEKRSSYSADRPHSSEEAKPFASLSERDRINYHHLGQANDASTAHSLNAAPDEDDRKVIGHRSDDGTSQEECQTDIDQCFASEYVREGAQDGLKNGRRQEE